MEPNETSSPEEYTYIPDEMKRAKYWANLLDKATDKYDIYIFAKSNLDSTNNNSTKQEEARKILEEAIRRYEEIHKYGFFFSNLENILWKRSIILIITS